MICPNCKEHCVMEPINDSFDYSGTHCNHGQGGTCHLPTYYVTNCCGEEIQDYNPTDEPDYDLIHSKNTF